MADKKISALTSASTPLAGTEVLPIVQSGSTVKVSVANLTAGRAVSTGALTSDSITTQTDVSGLLTLGRFSAGYPWVLVRPNSTASGIEFRSHAGDAQLVITQATGNVTFSMGNLIQGTAGKGIDFSANANAPGMTSELLNWYEEGTFTPTMIGATTAGTTTYSNQLGFYTRIGNRVMFNLTVVWTAATGTGQMLIGGLPFTSASSGLHAVVPCTISLDVGNITQIMPRIVTSATSIQMQKYAAGAVTDINVEATGTVVLSGQYRV